MDMKWVVRFAQDARGALAVTFAIVSVVLFGAAGMALDFINASGIRVSLQHALDSAVLAAAAAHVGTDDEAKTVIAEYMAVNTLINHGIIEAAGTTADAIFVNGNSTIINSGTLISLQDDAIS
jgi:Flp pilus assembly protein TadG